MALTPWAFAFTVKKVTKIAIKNTSDIDHLLNTLLILNRSFLVSPDADVFQGKKTASGSVYDRNKLTGAHKKIPFGTKVKITDYQTKITRNQPPLYCTRLFICLQGKK
jgi:hypothetical protein